MGKPKDGRSKYLLKFAEPEALAAPSPGARFQHVLVIPAYQEAIEQIELCFAQLRDLLVILVVNSPDPTDDQSQQLLKDISLKWQRLVTPGFYRTGGGTTVYVIDRVTQPIPEKEGVGRARKIGADIATRLIAEQHIASPWIHLTDADAILPSNYLQDSYASLQAVDTAFRLYHFRHDFTGDLAAALYEFSLIWYPLGLAYAGSAYGFPTIGSTIACHVDAYVKVRGFPPRAAGEDFYLLNKLRKIGSFRFVPAQIQLSNRRSGRVPFGTGPALTKIDELPDPLEVVFYHPKVFDALKHFLAQLDSSYEAMDLARHFSDDLSRQFVAEQKLLPLLARQQKQSETVYHKFIHDWFDGFRTLKFIHLARANAYPSVCFSELWESAILPDVCPGESVNEIGNAIDLSWQSLLHHTDQTEV